MRKNLICWWESQHRCCALLFPSIQRTRMALWSPLRSRIWLHSAFLLLWIDGNKSARHCCCDSHQQMTFFRIFRINPTCRMLYSEPFQKSYFPRIVIIDGCLGFCTPLDICEAFHSTKYVSYSVSLRQRVGWCLLMVGNLEEVVVYACGENWRWVIVSEGWIFRMYRIP